MAAPVNAFDVRTNCLNHVTRTRVQVFPINLPIRAKPPATPRVDMVSRPESSVSGVSDGRYDLMSKLRPHSLDDNVRGLGRADWIRFLPRTSRRSRQTVALSTCRLHLDRLEGRGADPCEKII